MAGHLRTKVAPHYPQEARENHVSGTVVLHALIARDGTIKDLTVISGDPLLADAAVAAVRQWTYEPYLLNGNPTEVNTTILVNFNMGPPPVSPGDISAESSGHGPIRVSGGVMAGNLIHSVQPVFPEVVRETHQNGSVVMHVIIGEDGHVRDVSVISGPEVLRQSYMDAVRQWVYRPYLLNGVPTAVDTTVVINIQMSGSPTP